MSSKRDREIHEEIEAHLRMAIRDRIDRGESAEDARAAVYREFGNVGMVKETTRSVWTWTTLEQIWQDFRFGSRILWKSPGLSATAVILIALVIGANTTIYSMVHAFMTRPAPGVTAKSLYYVGLVGIPSEPRHSYADYLDFAAEAKSLRSLFGFGPERITLGTDDGSYAMFGSYVTANYFDAVGVKAFKGRTFGVDTSGLVAVVSHRVWQERFHGADDVLGRHMLINGRDATIIGVAPPKFLGIDLGLPEDVWLPVVDYFRAMGRGRLLSDHDETDALMVLGQLPEDVPLSAAEADVRTISSRLLAAYPQSHKNMMARLVPYSAIANAGISQVGPRFLAIFSVVTALTLLIVCSNVANLMLARAVVKQRETAVRQSFGASRSRILRMSISEGLALSLAGWATACLFALWVAKAVNWLMWSDPTNGLGMRTNHLNLDMAPDWKVLAYAMVLAIVATMVFIVAPALRTWRRELLPYLKAGEPGIAAGRSKLSGVLVITQLAFSVLLLTSAALAYRSLSIIDTLDLHFDRSNLLLVTVNPTLNITERSTNLALLEKLRERLNAIPGVTAVSYVRLPPPFVWERERLSDPRTREPVAASLDYVGPDYLRTLGLTPRLGREFMPGDRVKGALISENLARTLWPGQTAVGQTLTLPARRGSAASPSGPPSAGRAEQQFEVIGATPNALFSGFQNDAAPNFIFLSEQQDLERATGQAGLRESGETTFYLRYAGNLDAVASSVGGALRDVDSRIPLVFMRTMERQLLNTGADTRIITILLTIFSSVSILIAAIGQYAVVAFDMRRRTREFGVRVAMGASSNQILATVLREGFFLTAVGLGIGFILSFAAGSAFSRFLYGVTPTDPKTYVSAFLVMAAASLLACYLPARRASRIDPLRALRYE